MVTEYLVVTPPIHKRYDGKIFATSWRVLSLCDPNDSTCSPDIQRRLFQLKSHAPNRARQDVCDSQEAWWLRKGCRRARCRLIKGLADAFGVPVKSIQVPSLDLAVKGVFHGEGLQERAPQASVEAGLGFVRGCCDEGLAQHGFSPMEPLPLPAK